MPPTHTHKAVTSRQHAVQAWFVLQKQQGNEYCDCVTLHNVALRVMKPGSCWLLPLYILHCISLKIKKIRY